MHMHMHTHTHTHRHTLSHTHRRVLPYGLLPQGLWPGCVLEGMLLADGLSGLTGSYAVALRWCPIRCGDHPTKLILRVCMSVFLLAVCFFSLPLPECQFGCLQKFVLGDTDYVFQLFISVVWVSLWVCVCVCVCLCLFFQVDMSLATYMSLLCFVHSTS